MGGMTHLILHMDYLVPLAPVPDHLVAPLLVEGEYSR